MDRAMLLVSGLISSSARMASRCSKRLSCLLTGACVLILSGCQGESQAKRERGILDGSAPSIEPVTEQWLAGDHHVHSRYSVGWNNETDPPTPIMGGDATYPIAMNVVMGRRHGLDWMVSTDHGGPNHAKINLEHAYPELLESRVAVPDVVQFMGMEFDTPGADHSSLIMPFHENEALDLYEIERTFNKREAWPADPFRDTEMVMVKALEFMRDLEQKPLIIAHHPSRSAKGYGEYGQTQPSELRLWNDTAPEIALGMEGAPGHQAIAQLQDRFGESKYGQYIGDKRPRGFYSSILGGYPTMGGFDQMTAKLGGFWDAMLGEGRGWWITANSDSHVHWKDGGVDFWPGEYSKTYVLAEKNSDSIFSSIRKGKIFVTTGDLISELWFTVESGLGMGTIGARIPAEAGSDVKVTIKIRDPDAPNYNGDNPSFTRMDLIRGNLFTESKSPDTFANPSTHVVSRVSRPDLSRSGEYFYKSFTIDNVQQSFYLRVRGTNTSELEPLEDPDGENPWADLWFYSNPIFIEVVDQS